MKLEAVTVKNFRSIREQTLELDGLTALVGANGAGKSAFIKAIELFQSEKPQVDEEDYHASTTEEDDSAPASDSTISIKLQFGKLSDSERAEFADYVPDGRLTVERAFEWDPDQERVSDTTYCYFPQDPRLKQIREASSKEAKILYNKIREEYNFDTWSSHAKAKADMAAWEKDHRANLQELRDDGKSFKIAGKAETTLDTYVRFIIVPAVRDASDDAAGKKDSAVLQLTEELTSGIYDDPEFAKFRESAMEKYAEMMDAYEAGRLKALAESVTRRVGELAEGIGVDLAWSDTRLEIDVPDTHARLAEGGMPLEAKRVGHGSQRAFIIAMLQEIAANAAAPPPEPGRSRTAPSLVLVIEEPELYQHPIRQRHMARVLADLARHTGGQRIQILYTSHSPHFVGMDRIESIRLIKKRQTGAEGLATTVHRTRLADVKGMLHGSDDSVGPGAPTDASLADSLRVTMTPWLNEGFFANLVVLVEGDNDYAAIQGAARSLDINFEKMGVSVIPCNGKNNLDKPLAVFASLGIRTYVVWDGDKCHQSKKTPKCSGRAGNPGNAKRTNRKLLGILGLPPTDWPSGVHKEYTCFEDNLNTSMRNEIGKSLYSNLKEDATRQFDIADEGGAEKKSLVMVEILKKAREKGHPCSTLDELVRTVERLADDEREARRGSKK